jgi:hypothetical protein
MFNMDALLEPPATAPAVTSQHLWALHDMKGLASPRGELYRQHRISGSTKFPERGKMQENDEERHLEARAVLNIPGYRENKVRSLLFKNARLEIQLKEERDKVVRLARANDALQRQLLHLNAQFRAANTAQAHLGGVIAESDLIDAIEAHEAADKQQQQEVIAELQGKVALMKREVSDLFQELQRCRVDQRRLQILAEEVMHCCRAAPFCNSTTAATLNHTMTALPLCCLAAALA